MDSFLSAIEVSRALLAYFLGVILNDCFKKTFSALVLEVRIVFKSGIKLHVPATEAIYEIIKKKAGTRSKPLKKRMFARTLDPMLREIETEQVQQMLRASLSVNTHGHKNSD